MQNTLHLQIGSVRFLCSREPTDIVILSILHDLRNIPTVSLIHSHSEVPCPAITIRRSDIL